MRHLECNRIAKITRMVRVSIRSIYINTYSLIAGLDCPALLLLRPVNFTAGPRIIVKP